MATELTETQLAFAAFVAIPDKVRGSKKDWAESHGIHAVTVSRWTKLPGFQAAVEAARSEVLVPQAIDVLTQLLNSKSERVRLEAAQSILKKWNPLNGQKDVINNLKELWEKREAGDTIFVTDNGTPVKRGGE